MTLIASIRAAISLKYKAAQKNATEVACTLVGAGEVDGRGRESGEQAPGFAPRTSGFGRVRILAEECAEMVDGVAAQRNRIRGLVCTIELNIRISKGQAGGVSAGQR